MNKERVMPAKFEASSISGVKVSQVKEWLFIGGTVPRDSQNVVVGKKDIKTQIFQVFENLEKVLREGGMRLNDLVQLNVYLTEDNSRVAFLEIARKIFKDLLVAQTILVVAGLHDPDVLIEIDGIACKQEDPTN